MSVQRRTVPKCLNCGNVTAWIVEPVLLPRHFMIGIPLILLFGGGLIYLAVVLAVRSNSANRAKICPRCGARNMWSFDY